VRQFAICRLENCETFVEEESRDDPGGILGGILPRASLSKSIDCSFLLSLISGQTPMILGVAADSSLWEADGSGSPLAENF